MHQFAYFIIWVSLFYEYFIEHDYIPSKNIFTVAHNQILKKPEFEKTPDKTRVF